MMPQSGEHVKVLFRNGTLVEGIVVEWYNNYVKLQSLTDESAMIISHPEEDIMLIKIFPPKTAEKEPVSEEAPLPETNVTSDEETDFEAQFQKLHSSPGNAYDLNRNKSLADLKAMAVEQERQIIAKKLKNHFPSNVRRAEYGYPGFLKKPSSK